MARAYSEYATETEDVLSFGEHVTLAVIVQSGRPTGTKGYVRIRYAAVHAWLDGLIALVTNYSDIDEGRAAAEQLAKVRASRCRRSVEIVQRAIHAFSEGEADTPPASRRRI